MSLTGEKPSSNLPNLEKPVKDIRRHVLQIETMILFVLGFQVIILFKPLLDNYLGDFSLIIPLVYLTLLPLVMRVNNPWYTPRSILNGFITGMGAGGGIGGAAAGAATGGLGAPEGFLIGAAAGGVIGAIISPWTQGSTRNNLLERGDAFEYLYKHRKKKFWVANPRLVNQALDLRIPSYDINEDGRKWYLVDDLNDFLRSPKKFHKSFS